MTRGLRTPATAIAWGALVTTIALTSLLFEIPLADTDVPGYVGRFFLYGLVSALTFAALGTLIAANRPANRLGWLWLLISSFHAVALFCQEYGLAGVWGVADLPGAPWVLWFGEWIAFPPYWLLPTVLILLTPDGRLPSPKWRPAALLGVAAAAVSTLGWALLALEDSDITSHPPGFVSPAPTWSGAPALQGIGALLGLTATVAAFASFVFRYRRSTLAQRPPLKWIAFGAAVTVVVLVAAFFEPGPGGWLLALSSIPLPLAVTVAILKHHLLDIDAVINRSLVYGLLTIGVAAVYVAGVLGFAALLGTTTGAPLFATALVAIAVHPAAVRLGRFANRVVYGYQDDPAAVLRALGDRLDGAATNDTVPAAADSLRRALRLSSVTVSTADGSVLATSGDPRGGTPESFVLAHRGEPVGRLEITAPPGGPLTASARTTLTQVARQLAVVLYANELTDDLQRSQERLVVAREEERRRIRRELHDGLGPTLAAMALQVDRARALATGDPAAAEALLDQLSRRIRHAVGEVRGIVEDLGIPELDDLGLAAAVTQMADRFTSGGLPVTAQVDLNGTGSVPAAVEVAAYRIVGEALTNASRHAGASHCTVSIHAAGDAVKVVVHDDGRGIDINRQGSGIGVRSMHQRAAQLGGTLSLEPDPAGGTTVEAILPAHQPEPVDG